MIIKKNGKNYLIKNPLTIQGMKCYLCDKQASCSHHIIFGRGKRKVSDREGMTVALCNACHYKIHNWHLHDKELKAIAQEVWLEHNGGDNEKNRKKWYSMYYKFYDL